MTVPNPKIFLNLFKNDENASIPSCENEEEEEKKWTHTHTHFIF